MPLPTSPEALLLGKILELEQAFGWDAFIGKTFTWRHWRNRHARADERPCGSIRFVDVNPDEDRGRYHSTDEECWRMSVELIFDMDLATESSGDDPTGVNALTVACNKGFRILRPVEGGGLTEFCDDVLDMGCGPDEDSGADEGRLVQSLFVLYRTPVGDRSVLLAPGVNL